MSFYDAWQRFDQAADQYDQATPLQQQSAELLLQQIGTVQPDSVWLDAGCGTGRLAKRLAAQQARVWAVDRALAMLQPLRAEENIQIICTDLRELPMPDEMLDGLVSNFALHWLGASILPELLRVVRPEGELHLAIPVAGSLSAVQQRFAGFPVFAFESEQVWLDAAADTLVSSEVVTLTQSFEHLYALLQSLRQMGGDQVADAGYRPEPQRMRQWLRDRAPIELDYRVLLLRIKKPAATDGFSRWLQQVQGREG